MANQEIERQWSEVTVGAMRPNAPSPYRHQIDNLRCLHCKFVIDPGLYRIWDDNRKDHPQPYGNFASISHARKVMRDHIREKHFGDGNKRG